MNYRVLCAFFLCTIVHVSFFIHSMEKKMIEKKITPEDPTKYYTLTPNQVRQWKSKYDQSSLGRKRLTTSSPIHAATIFNQEAPLTPQQATYKLIKTMQELRASKDASSTYTPKITTLLDAKADVYKIIVSNKDFNDTIAHKILEHIISSGNLELLTQCLIRNINFKKKIPQAIDTPYGMVLKVSKMDEVKAFKHAQTVLDLIDEHEKKQFSAQGIGSEIN